MRKFFEKVYQKKHLILVLFLAVVSVIGIFFLPKKQIDWKKRILKFSDVQEIAVGMDRSVYINDGNKKIIAMDDDGNLRYQIELTGKKKNAQFSKITVDEKGNLYAYVTEYASGGTSTISDSIYMYDTKGNFLKCLYYKEYEDEANQVQDNRSKMYIHNNKLEFAFYKSYSNIFYSIDIETGDLKTLYEQEFSIPYLYQDIYLTNHMGYYYVKINGEIGYGIIGKSESALYEYTFDSEENGPFTYTLVPLEGVYYCYDTHKNTVLKLNNENGFEDMFQQITEPFIYLNVSNGLLCGTTGSFGWYMDYDEEIHYYREAKLSMGQLMISLLHIIARSLCYLILGLAAIYAVVGIVYAYVGPQTSVFYKLFLLLPLILIAVSYLLFTVFRFYQQDYARTDYDRIACNVKIVADSIDGELLKEATNSQFFTKEAYKQLEEKLLESFFSYSSARSEVSAQILVQNSSGVYVYADTSSDAKLMSLYQIDEKYDGIEDMLQQNKQNNTAATMVFDGENYNFYSPIHNEQEVVAGYLFVTTPQEHEMTVFWKTIQSLSDRIIFSVFAVFIILFLTARFMSKSAKRASKTIIAIADGNLNARVKSIGNDEIGQISSAINRMADNLQESIEKNKQLTEDVRLAQSETIAAFAEITEAKSGQTGQHVKRVSSYTRLLAEAAGYDAEEVERISVASMMHDIGKLLIPGEILDKPGKLTDEEFEIIKKHCEYGEQLLHNSHGQIMGYARTIALEHHERYGGGGYPNNKKGTEIAKISRMVSIADVFDALVSKRSYKEKWNMEDAFLEIKNQSGKQFDPVLVELFLERKEQVKEICERLPD